MACGSMAHRNTRDRISTIRGMEKDCILGVEGAIIRETLLKTLDMGMERCTGMALFTRDSGLKECSKVKERFGRIISLLRRVSSKMES